MGQIIRKTKDGRFIGWYLRWREGSRRICIASKQPTAAAAKKMLVQIEAQVARGERGLTRDEAEPVSTLTVSELCERFLATSHPRAKCPVAYRRKARAGLKMILPALGNLPLDKLRRRDLEDARDRLSGSYRPNTVRSALRPLATALSWAVRQELITQSPISRMVLPRLEQSTEHLRFEDAQKLLREAEQQKDRVLPPIRKLNRHSLYVAVSLATRLGLRRGEVFGLRWTDVNLQQNQLTVARSYDGPTKNSKSRTLPLSFELATLLRDWRAICPASAARVCPVASRTRVGLASLLRAAGCPPLQRGWHSLRHTFATLWLEQGGSIMTLKEMLGHSSLSMVLVYSHLSSAALAADMAKMKL